MISYSLRLGGVAGRDGVSTFCFCVLPYRVRTISSRGFPFFFATVLVVARAKATLDWPLAPCGASERGSEVRGSRT